MLDENSPFSLYYQLKNIIIEKIKTKEWPLNTKIPTERELCEIYNVSRITVRKALNELEQEGYLHRKQGKGTYVKGQTYVQRLSSFYSFSEEIRKMGSVPSAQLLSYEVIDAGSEISQKLGIKPEDQVLAIRRLRLADNEPFAIETSYLVHRYTKALKKEDVAELGLYKALEKDCSIKMSDAVETFEAVNIICSEHADYLGVSKNQAAFHLSRTAYSNGVIIEYCSSLIRGDKYKFAVQLRRNDN